MKPTIHPIKIDFHVTPAILRYVYIYLIEGREACYLIDAGVAGAEEIIEGYLHTPGHSPDQLSYLLPEAGCLFTGDAIPVRGDIPIWVQRDDARRSLETLRELPGVETFYPAWDTPYDRPQAMEKLTDALSLMEELQSWVDRCKDQAASPEELVQAVCTGMQTPHFLQNPLFRQTVQSMLPPDCPCKHLDCERHGNCAACQAHHHAKDHLTRCEKLKKKEQRKADRQSRLG